MGCLSGALGNLSESKKKKKNITEKIQYVWGSGKNVTGRKITGKYSVNSFPRKKIYGAVEEK